MEQTNFLFSQFPDLRHEQNQLYQLEGQSLRKNNPGGKKIRVWGWEQQQLSQNGVAYMCVETIVSLKGVHPDSSFVLSFH